MKLNSKYVLSIFLAVTMLLSWSVPAFAATVISVTPSAITNDADRTITVSGTDFDNSAVILLDGFALTTNFLNNQTLTATVPAGLSPKTYSVTVTMSGAQVTGTASLAVSAPPTPIPTSTPTVTPTLATFSRPQIVISSYKANVASVKLGKEFVVGISFNNAGSFNAVNAQVVFTSADVVPTNTGGVIALGSIPAAGQVNAAQSFLAINSIYGKSAVVIEATVTYYDDKGTSYTDKFTLNIPASGVVDGDSYPTATPTGVNNAQLVITSYGSTIDPLQPGEQFQLGVTVQNMGNSEAKNVTMIVGGGSSGTSGGTPQPGGVSGGSGEFTNFAPVGSSNIQSLGSIPAGGALQAKQNLVVNVSTNPGAYPMKITFSYVNSKGEVINDEQVITLLVYSLPNLDVSFYSPPGILFTGQPGALPLQVVNLGKRTAVLGNMKIEAANGTIDPATTLVGSLDPGGYFTFDSTLFPETAGSLELKITIDYTDDFNQSRTVERTLTVEVEESFVEPAPEPGMEGGGEFPTQAEETFAQKAWRFVLGLFGLDSAPPVEEAPVIMEDPSLQQFPAPAGGKGG